MNLGKVLKKYQMGGKLPSNSQKAVDAYTNEANRLKQVYAKRDQSSDGWLDIPQKTAMKLAGLGYQKPSDFLYAHGLKNVPYHQEAALIADLVADPLNLIPIAKVANLKKGTVGSGSLVKGLNYLDDVANVDEVYNYGKKKASEVNNWLGETTGYKFPCGGIMKNYSFGGDLGKYVLNGLETSTIGGLGLDFYKPKYDTKGFQVADDITQGMFKATNGLKLAAANMLLPGSGTAIGGIQQGGKAIQQTLSNTTQFPKGGIMRNYQQGGIMPQNPNDLQAITENTMEFNGNSHKSGGIPLNNGKELEKDETVIKQGAIGNADPYAISPNLVLDRETAKLVGLSSKYAGMKLSDISRKIEDMKALKEDAMSEKTNSMNKKFALNRLIKANELLSAQHRQEQPVNEISDLRQEEMAYGGGIEYGKPLYQPLQNNFQLGDRSDLGNMANNYAMNLGRDRIMQNEIPNVGTSVLNNSTNLNVPNLTVPQVDFPKEKTSFDLKSNLGNIGMGLKGASLLANFAAIGKKPGQIPAQFNPYTNDILANYRNSIDNQSIKNDVTSVLNTGLNANPSRNWNVQRAANAELVGKSMEAMSKANLQNQEANNRYRSELGNVENNLGVQNVQAKNMAEVLNAQTQANWRNNLRQGIGNIGNDAADMLIQKQFVQDATRDGMALTKEKIKILQNKWGSSFGADSDKFMDMLQSIFPSYTKEQLTKIASE